MERFLTDIYSSGDEAMLMAKSLSNVSIVVQRVERGQLDLPRGEGLRLYCLHDGFNRVRD